MDSDVAFATRLFSHLRSIRDHSLDASHPAFFVLDRYCKQRSQDAYSWHLLGLVCESIRQYDLGVEAIERAITILEAAYEESEDPTIERRYAIAHINVGRLKLSKGDSEGASLDYRKRGFDQLNRALWKKRRGVASATDQMRDVIDVYLELKRRGDQ